MESSGRCQYRCATRFLSNVVALEQDYRVTTAEAPTILADVEESVGGFGPLKSLLKVISAVYANHKVSPPLPSSNSALADHSVGILRRRGQGEMAPLTRNLSGRAFYDTPKLQRREETQR